VGAAGSREEAVKFARLTSAIDIVDRLSKIWDSPQGPCRVLDRGRALLGAVEIRFVNAIRDSADVSGNTLLICGARLPPDVVNSRKEFSCSILGCEEFVVLAKELAGREGVDQSLLIGVLSRLHRVCYRELIESIAAEIAGGWLPGSVDELSAPLRPRTGTWSDSLTSEIRLTALAAPLFSAGSQVAAPSDLSPPVPLIVASTDSVASNKTKHTKAAVAYLRSALESSIEVRQLAAANYDLPIVRQALIQVQNQHRRIIEIEELLSQVSSEADMAMVVAEINSIGSELFGATWQMLEVSS
jgi:hypothetical protein